MARTEYFDALETRSFEEREIALAAALEVKVAHAKGNAPFFAEWLKDVDPATVKSRAALARLPILRKADLTAMQKRNPPMGGLLSIPGRAGRCAGYPPRRRRPPADDLP